MGRAGADLFPADPVNVQQISISDDHVGATPLTLTYDGTATPAVVLDDGTNSITLSFELVNVIYSGWLGLLAGFVATPPDVGEIYTGTYTEPATGGVLTVTVTITDVPPPDFEGTATLQLAAVTVSTHLKPFLDVLRIWQGTVESPYV